MRMILTLLAIGGAAYALTRKNSHRSANGNAAFADGQPRQSHDDIRDSGPEAMRDPPAAKWTGVDEASDQSFPASDPPGNY
jgi:hypothetical protein